MQTLTDDRATLLTSDRLEVSAGLEVLDLDLTVTDDVSDDLVGGSVSRSMYARIHGTCKLSLSRELAWGNVLVRPYMLVNGERFNAGVFMLVTPEHEIGEDPTTYSVQGFDRLYLLDREVGEDYTAVEGWTYYDAILDAFLAAGVTAVEIGGPTSVLIDTSAGAMTLPADKTWPLVSKSTDPDQTSTPVTWLRIVNDLLNAINFQAVWADENGFYRCHEYKAPSERAVEYTFDAGDDLTIVGVERTVVADQWKTPNRWVFLWSNGGTGIEGDGIYTYDLPDEDPMSAYSRGLIWSKSYSYEAADQDTLEALGNRRIAQDRRTAETIKVTTGTFPAAGHFDVFSYVDADAGGTRKVVATDWELDLLGADTRWSWQTVVV